MQISTHSRYLDYPAKSIYARQSGRLPADDLIRRVGERAEEERRKSAARRRPLPSPTDDERDGVSNVVPVPFAVSGRRDATETVQVTPTASTSVLWSLIDAVEAGGAPGVSTPPANGTPQKSSAESLYLLLAQVIAED